MENHISREELEELLDSLDDEGFGRDVEKQLRTYFEKILHDFHRNNQK